MKKIVISAMALLAVSGAWADGLSLRDQAQLSRENRREAALRVAGAKSPAKVRGAVAKESTEYVSALVRLQPGTDTQEFGDDVDVITCRGGFAIVTMPRPEVERIASHPSIKSFSLSRPVKMKLDRARAVSGIDKIHTGEGLPSNFIGRGVVAGVVDNGIDPNHVNFLYPDGTSRVSMLSVAGVNSKGQPSTTVYDRTTIGKFESDDPSTYHGTHTLGILAGSYDGTGKMAYTNAQGQYVLDEKCSRTPFYGVAPGADLAVGAKSDYDAFIVYNIENILNYAHQTNKRAVINLSLGSSMGPHDGSTSLNQYLDLVSLDGKFEIEGETYDGDNAIICISAGNEGDMPIAWNKTVSATDPEAKTFFISLIDDELAAEQGLKNMRMGHLYVYGNDERPFKVQIVAWNNKRSRAAWSKTLVEPSAALQYYCSAAGYQDSEADVVDPTFARYFEGYVGLGTAVDPDSGRYMAIVDIAAIDNITDTYNQNEEYSLGMIVTYIADDGKPQIIEAYGDAEGVQGMGSLGKEGWIEPDGNGTISDMACGKNQIIVGSYNTRESWLSLDGSIYGYGENVIPEGEVTAFSSFGTLHDGRTLPHVLAPGATIISSSNYYFHTNKNNVSEQFNPMWPSVRQGEASFGAHDHYWVQMSGTSMSSPLVAGAMALWLEADPTLNVDDMRDIIAATSVKDAATAKAPAVQVGAGKFDAYAGLKEVLRRASVENVTADLNSDNLMIRALGDRRYEVALPGADKVDATLVDALGRAVGRWTSDEDEVIIDASALNAGLYIVSVNGSLAKKIIIK